MTNFLENYAIFSSGNEAPEIFHKWAALSTLSAVVGRRVYVTQGHWDIHCNLYVIFVGEPANGKSTAMGISKRLVQSVPGIPLMASSITKERLTQLLAEEDEKKQSSRIAIIRDGKPYEFSQASIFSNEIVTLLGSNPMGMIDFFTDVWDEEEFVVETKNKGTDKIPHPYVTILGCMTPQITSALLKQNIISGGFSRRCIFVYHNKRAKPIPRPVVTDEQRLAKKRCMQRLLELDKIRGQFKWTPGAEEFFDAWYLENHHKLQHATDLVLQGYYKSKDGLLLKASMLIQLARSNELVLTFGVMQQALDLLNAAEENLTRVFSGTGENKQAQLAERIINLLEAYEDPVKVKQIYQELFNDGDRNTIEQTIHHLVSTDKIRRVSHKGAECLELL